MLDRTHRIRRHEHVLGTRLRRRRSKAEARGRECGGIAGLEFERHLASLGREHTQRAIADASGKVASVWAEAYREDLGRIVGDGDRGLQLLAR